MIQFLASSFLPVFALCFVDVAVGPSANFAAFEVKKVLDPLSHFRGFLLEFIVHDFWMGDSKNSQKLVKRTATLFHNLFTNNNWISWSIVALLGLSWTWSLEFATLSVESFLDFFLQNCIQSTNSVLKTFRPIASIAPLQLRASSHQLFQNHPHSASSNIQSN